jgi:sortase A
MRGRLPAREFRGGGRHGGGPRTVVLAALIGVGATLLTTGFWIPVKAELAQQLLNRAWAAAKDAPNDRPPQRPWPWADTWPVARLRLPISDKPFTVLAGASGRNLAFAPALMDGSARPGTLGVSVIAGHRDTHFRELGKLAAGDRFEIERADGAAFAYEVAAIDVIDADRAMLRLDADESVVMLVTCYPFDAVVAGGSLRYVVTAYRVADSGAVDPSAAIVASR